MLLIVSSRFVGVHFTQVELSEKERINTEEKMRVSIPQFPAKRYGQACSSVLCVESQTQWLMSSFAQTT